MINESGLQFPFDETCRFDGSGHGLSHCMKAVDFIINADDRDYFIEVKNPSHPKASKTNRDKFIRSFKSDELKKNLVQKFRDTLLYRFAEEKVDNPIHYLVLLCLDGLVDRSLLQAKTDDLRRHIPVGNDVARWKQSLAEECIVLYSPEDWNKHFPKWKIDPVSTDS